jgi:hypothetical protein
MPWIGLPFLTAWLFGREFADRTIRGLFAIPTPPPAIVVAKSIGARGTMKPSSPEVRRRKHGGGDVPRGFD